MAHGLRWHVESSRTRDQTCGLCTGRQIPIHYITGKVSYTEKLSGASLKLICSPVFCLATLSPSEQFPGCLCRQRFGCLDIGLIEDLRNWVGFSPDTSSIQEPEQQGQTLALV